MNRKGNTLIIGGQSRLPKDLSQGESLQVIVELDTETGQILDVSFGPCLPMIQNFLRDFMIGINLEADAENLLEVIRQRFHHRSQKAFIAAIRDLLREYNEFKYGVPKGPQSISAS